ncbi:MAG: thiol:disulfide interchange protein DsbA/DsbL [Neptuniibacter sp.]
MKKLGLMLFALLLPFSVQAEEFKEGVHYAKITQPVRTIDQSRVEVVEMFGYPCPHCNSFEPFIKNWVKDQAEDVNFVRIPVVFGRSWDAMARAYYASELSNTLDKTHEATFNAVHVEKRRLTSKKSFSDFYSKLGVDTAKFEKMFDSFAVNMKLRQGESKLRGYGVTGVPAMVVNGKYRISAQMAGGQKEMLDVVNFLVEKERSTLK